MIRLLPAAALLFATLAAAPACAYEAPYQPGWGPAPVAPVWYQRPAPPPRWGWGPPPARWHAPPPRWAGPPRRDWRGERPYQTRYDHRRRDDRRDYYRGDRRW